MKKILGVLMVAALVGLAGCATTAPAPAGFGDQLDSIKTWAAAGNKVDKRRLALAYLNGWGVEKDVKKSESLMDEAAEAGDLWALVHSGGRHYTGEYTLNKDLANKYIDRAFKEWKRKAGIEFEQFELLSEIMGRRARDREGAAIIEEYCWAVRINPKSTYAPVRNFRAQYYDKKCDKSLFPSLPVS